MKPELFPRKVQASTDTNLFFLNFKSVKIMVCPTFSMTDTYKAGFDCKNCGASYNYDVPLGTNATDFSKDAKCKNCQTVKLVATHETFSE